MQLLKTSVAALSLAAIASTQIPCWETNLGTNLFMADDDYSNQPLNFTFPFAGTTYTDIVICSNGFVWLGANPPPTVPVTSPTLYQITVNNFLTQGPRIAPLWNDFNPDPAAGGNPNGGVYYNTFPAGGGNPARAVVTWDRVYEYNQTTPLSMQLTLVEGGDVIVHYDSNMAIVAGGFSPGAYPNHIVGASDGTNTSNPVSFQTLPIVTGSNANMHELIPRGAFPLVGKDFQWIANGSGGYVVVERTNCTAGTLLPYGFGCPKNMTAYEHFSTNGTFDLSNTSILFQANASGGFTALPGPGFDTSYSAAIPMGDDDVLPAQPLGFSFPFAGAMHTAVDISSNGILWAGNSGYTSPLINGYPGGGATLVAEPAPVIAPMWMDLDPSSGGTVYWDTGSNFAMITWVNVPYFGVAGSSNTVQAKLFSSGDVVLSYMTANNDGPLLVGISEAVNTLDPGPVDWSAALPLSIGSPNTQPLVLDAQAGSRPAVGTTFNLELSNIPSGTSVGAMVFGFTQQNPGLSLTSIGMAGCSQYLNTDATFLLNVTGPTATFGLMIPNNTAYLGTVLYAQGATFSSGFNTLGVIASNGGEIRVGT